MGNRMAMNNTSIDAIADGGELSPKSQKILDKLGLTSKDILDNYNTAMTFGQDFVTTGGRISVRNGSHETNPDVLGVLKRKVGDGTINRGYAPMVYAVWAIQYAESAAKAPNKLKEQIDSMISDQFLELANPQNQ